MLNHSNVANHVKRLRENRVTAMTCARTARALGDAELMADYIHEARTASRLIVNSRAVVREQQVQTVRNFRCKIAREIDGVIETTAYIGPFDGIPAGWSMFTRKPA